MDIKPPKSSKKHLGKASVSEPQAAEHIEPHKPRAAPGGGWQSTLSTILLFTMAPILALLIAAYGLQSYQVDGQSMETTLQNKDRLIVDKIPRTWARITRHAYVPKRGDIIVFNQSGLFDASGVAEKQLIKRVIGLPGDHVVVANGKITIFNARHPGGFDPDMTGGYKINVPTNPTGNYTDVTLGPNQIFVCGDNRPFSEDSRYFGPVNVNQVVGQLVLRIIPLDKAERF